MSAGWSTGLAIEFRFGKRRVRTVKPYSCPAYEPNQIAITGWPASGPDEEPDRLYWMVAPDALFAVRPSSEGQFLYAAVNPAFEAIFGTPSEAIRERPVSDLMNAQNVTALYKAFRTCLADGIEVRLCHHFGLGKFAKDIETIVTPIYDPNTCGVIGLIGSHRLSREGGSVVDVIPSAYGDMGAKLISLQQDIQQRIASDLHDSTCQHLIAASLSMMRIRVSFDDRANAEKLCDDVDASIDHALAEIRAFTYMLHPQNPTMDGLKATIEQYACGFAARTSLKVATDITPDVDQLPYNKQSSLLRIIQEALTNIFRHAKATEVEVAIEALEGRFRLCVRDNGQGMAGRHTRYGASEPALGVGIPAMRARMQQLGGMLKIRSTTARGTGTTLCAVFPHRLASKPQSAQVSPHCKKRTRPRNAAKS